MNDQPGTWTVAELERELEGFESELRGVGLAENSVRTYLERARSFVRWLAGEFTPRGPRS